MSEQLFRPDKPPARIAIVRALFLGDLLCSLPALQALRRAFPDAEITLIGLPWASALVSRVGCIDRLEAFPGYPRIAEVPYDERRSRAFFQNVRSRPFDLAIQMHGNGGVSNGFVAELGAQRTLGHAYEDDRRLNWSTPFIAGMHEVLRWIRLVGMLGVAGDPLDVGLVTTAREREQAAKMLYSAKEQGKPRVVLHPGSKDPARRWPPERFAELGDALIDRYNARVILTGTAQECSITAAVRSRMRHPALDLAGETDLGVLAALLKQVDLVVTNDTGASHLAAATSTRSVVLFGPSWPVEWAPLDRERHRVIEAQRFVPGETDGARALQALPVDRVLEECETAIARRGAGAAANEGRRALQLARSRAWEREC